MWKVVIIEDEDLLRNGLIGTIPWEKMGFEVAGEADNGRDGLEVVERIRPHVVFTDIRMARMDGLTMAEKIREKDSEVLLVFISGYDEFEYARRALKLGAEEYILKPVQLGQVEETLRRIDARLQERKSHEKEYRELKKLEEYYRSQDELNRGMRNDKEQTSLERAIGCMQRKYGNENLMIADVAEYAGISSSYLSLLLKKETGKTFIEYLTDIRMEYAGKLLKGTQQKTYEIARACGFASATYFSTVFKNMYGMSPSAFRRKYMKSNGN